MQQRQHFLRQRRRERSRGRADEDIMLLQLYYHTTVSNTFVLFTFAHTKTKTYTYSSQNAWYVLVERKSFTISILYLGAIVHSFERRCDVGVDPKRPECVVDVEYNDFGK